MMTFSDLASVPSDPLAPFTDQLRLAVAAYLARFKGSSREHTRAPSAATTIRLTKLGYQVDAVEVSAVACEKIERFARSRGVRINVRNEALETVDLTGNSYDVVLMNGCLHYVRGKSRVLSRVLAASAADAVHAVAVFSTATPVPAEHAVVPVFPDEEGGVVESFYQDWDMLLRTYQRGRRERSHPGFAPHVHSHIKLIAARSVGGTGDQ